MSPAEQETRTDARKGFSVPTRLRLLEADADQAERDRVEAAAWRAMITKMVIAFLVSAILGTVALVGNLLYQISITKASVKP